jgi:hypothetical protein
MMNPTQEVQMKNWAGDPAELCWMCGSDHTQPLDHETRKCLKCGNWYAIESAHQIPQQKVAA